MNRKRLGLWALTLGIILIVAGILVQQVIVPRMKKFPDDVDTIRTYVGTMPVLLDTNTFQFMTDLEVDLERHYVTEATDGDIALVREDQKINWQDAPLLGSVDHYTLDRKTMEAVDTYPNDWENKENLYTREGLVLGFPIGTEKKDYDGWSGDYRETVVLKFEEEVEHEGVETYYFTSSSGPLPIAPEKVEAMSLPPALPHEQLLVLLEGALDNPLMTQAFPALIEAAEWPDPLPLNYFYEYESQYWVEPTSGVLIDTTKNESRSVSVSEDLLLALGAQLENLGQDPAVVASMLPLKVFHLEYQATEQSIADATQDAEDAKSKIDLYGTTLPYGVMLLGLILGAIGILFVRQ